MKRLGNLFLISILIVSFLSSCGDFKKTLKSTNKELKLSEGFKYYEKKKYSKALLLFEQVFPLLRGDEVDKMEKVHLAYAYCFYYQGQFESAIDYFQSFFESYPKSAMFLEAYYMFCKTHYMMTPSYNLDQSNTVRSISVLQEFLNYYPDSKYANEISKMQNELREKLETKAFENAKLYHKLEYFRAAVTDYDNFAKEFPDSKYIAETCYLKMLAYYDWSKVSSINTKEDRLKKCVEVYFFFVDRYKNSEFLKQAETLYATVLKDMDELKKLKEKEN